SLDVSLASYDQPVLHDYRSPAFRAARVSGTARILEACAQSSGTFVRVTGEPWIRHVVKASSAARARRPLWQPKLYVCVSAAHYWPVVLRLVRRLDHASCAWKFFLARGGYQRPDKIVFY